MAIGAILDKVEEFSNSVIKTLALLDGGGSRRRRKREGEDEERFWYFCEHFTQLHEVLLELKDGSMFSFAKIKHQIDSLDETVLALEGATKEKILACYETETWLKDMTERTVKVVVNKLAHWIKVKRYPDDFSIAEDTECEYGYNEEDMEGDYPCNCECKRKNKVLGDWIRQYVNSSILLAANKLHICVSLRLRFTKCSGSFQCWMRARLKELAMSLSGFSDPL